MQAVKDFPHVNGRALVKSARAELHPSLISLCVWMISCGNRVMNHKRGILIFAK